MALCVPCPNCGALPKARKADYKRLNRMAKPFWEVFCNNWQCDASPSTRHCETLATARKAWNDGMIKETQKSIDPTLKQA